jgi:hypothetical protein
MMLYHARQAKRRITLQTIGTHFPPGSASLKDANPGPWFDETDTPSGVVPKPICLSTCWDHGCVLARRSCWVRVENGKELVASLSLD